MGLATVAVHLIDAISERVNNRGVTGTSRDLVVTAASEGAFALPTLIGHAATDVAITGRARALILAGGVGAREAIGFKRPCTTDAGERDAENENELDHVKSPLELLAQFRMTVVALPSRLMFIL